MRQQMDFFIDISNAHSRPNLVE